MADAHKNFAVSSVATAPSPATSGTSLVVASGEGARFPAVPFNAVIAPASATPTPANAEVVRVTARSTDTLTITRAQESSTARTVIVGDRIYAGLTAAHLDQYVANSLVDAKGDIITATADDTPVRKAVGNDGEMIVADSTQADGLKWTPVPTTTWTASGQILPLAAPASTATGAVNTWYQMRVRLLNQMPTMTGIEFKNGATVNGNVRAALYSLTSTKLADRTTDVVQTGTNARQRVAFDSTYNATPGTYWMLLWFSSATATAFMCPILSIHGATGTNVGGTPTSSGAAQDMTATPLPLMNVY